MMPGPPSSTLFPYTTLFRSVTVSNADTTPPTVAITSPASGSTVSNTIPVSATASDNVAGAGVQFMVDGGNLGAEDTASPYLVGWSHPTTPAALQPPTPRSPA